VTSVRRPTAASHADARTETDERAFAPRAWVVLVVGLAASPAIAFIHASQFVLQRRLEGTSTTLFWEWRHLLLPWITFAFAAASLVPFVRRFPLPQKHPARAIAAHVAAALLFPVVWLGLLDVVHVLANWARFVDHLVWMLSDTYLMGVMLFWAAAGTLHAIRHVRAQHALREDALRLKAALAEARLAALSHQLRPHFLFNALNSAAMLVRGGESAQAIEVLARLSGLIRELLRERPHEVVPLTHELEFLREYLLLERVRFGDRLGVTLEVDQRLGDSPVPFLILQPVVENAIRYGIAARAGRSQLRVGATSARGTMVLRVEERGAGGRAGPAESGHGVGLAITRERLRARYGDRATVSLTVDPDGSGSLAEIRLPSELMAGA
jgi:two-component system, LytTR family, sensor kinase